MSTTVPARRCWEKARTGSAQSSTNNHNLAIHIGNEGEKGLLTLRARGRRTVVRYHPIAPYGSIICIRFNGFDLSRPSGASTPEP
jgi:hypothetical protein